MIISPIHGYIKYKKFNCKFGINILNQITVVVVHIMLLDNTFFLCEKHVF